MVLICDCDAPYAHDWVTLPVVVIDRCMVGRQLDCGKHLCNDDLTFVAVPRSIPVICIAAAATAAWATVGQGTSSLTTPCQGL